MKSKVCFIILLFSLSNFITVYANDFTFPDIENHWAKEMIIESCQNSIVNGYPDHTFHPDKEVTVAEFIKMVITAGKYTLLPNGNKVWPDFYISTALNKNMIIEQEFAQYNIPITRYETVEIMARVIDLSGISKGKNIYQDLDKSHQENVLKLSKLKIINGYQDKTFRGENAITRAEAVAIIKRSMEAKKKIDTQRTYEITKRSDLSNYHTGVDEISPSYEIEDNYLKIYDEGRYSNLQGYTVSNHLIDISKVSRIIQSLICEQTYTKVLYIPSPYTVNQLKIIYGESADKIENGGFDFSFTYFEDKEYELSRISMEEKFSEECYLKIEVLKLWSSYSDYLKGDYIDPYKKEKLYEALVIEFGKENATKILKYFIEKNESYISNQTKGEYLAECKKIGKYMINFYQTENDIPKFYISKLK